MPAGVVSSPSPPSASAATRIPLLDLGREFAIIREEVLAAIEAVCAAQHFVLGPPAERFEAEARQICQAHAALGCASGTDALWLALAALGVGPGAAVVTSPFSFFATASAILRAGARPIFADIDPRTFNLSPASVAEVLSRPLPAEFRAAALLPVHLYGQCADMGALNVLAGRFDLRVIEDAAQAFGAAWHGQPAGSLGDAAAFSFYPTKNLAAFGDAGLVTFQSAETAERAHALRNHGMRQRYFHEAFDGHLGWNSRLDGIQAAVLSVKLRRLPAANQRRRDLASLYDQLFTAAGLTSTTAQAGIVLPWTAPGATPIFHQYVIRTAQRDALRQHLTAHGIGTEIYYPLPLHLQESLAFLGYRAGDFPVAEAAAREVLALPIFPELRKDEVERVVSTIAAFFRGNRA